MSDEITVKVNSYGPGRPLGLVWIDPVSGKKKARSSGTSDWREAERVAGELQRELRAGRGAGGRITWPDFKARYLGEHVASLAPKTAASVRAAFNHVDRHLGPDKLHKLTPGALSTLQSKLRATGIREPTIASVLRHVKAALGWAKSTGLIDDVPKITMPKRAKGKGMKGGPLLGEQFDRLLLAVAKIRRHDADDWTRFLEGLLVSGLRLGEAVQLSWENDAPFSLDLSGRHPRFRIKGAAQKSGKDQLLPMVPEAAEFFLATPPERRHGRVFRLNAAKTAVPLAAGHVGKVVARIGEKARVIVNPADGKYASAHDLRRTFGSKWARRVVRPCSSDSCGTSRLIPPCGFTWTWTLTPWPMSYGRLTGRRPATPGRLATIPATMGWNQRMGPTVFSSQLPMESSVVKLRPAGFEPATSGLEIRCSIP